MSTLSPYVVLTGQVFLNVLAKLLLTAHPTLLSKEYTCLITIVSILYTSCLGIVVRNTFTLFLATISLANGLATVNASLVTMILIPPCILLSAYTVYERPIPPCLKGQNLKPLVITTLISYILCFIFSVYISYSSALICYFIILGSIFNMAMLTIPEYRQHLDNLLLIYTTASLIIFLN